MLPNPIFQVVDNLVYIKFIAAILNNYEYVRSSQFKNYSIQFDGFICKFEQIMFFIARITFCFG